MPKKSHTSLIITIVVIVLLGLAGFAYWYFLIGPSQVPPDQQGTNGNPVFTPINRPGGANGSQGTTTGGTNQPGQQNVTTKLPTLRLLSSTPVGGYGTLVSGPTTTVRWVDRGRGNVYEANYRDSGVVTLSNTVVPRIYDSAWNKNLSAFVGRMLVDGDMTPTAVYAELVKQSASSTSSVAPYELRGKSLPAGLIGYTVSPDRNKLFMLVKNDTGSSGYISSVNGQGMTRLFDTPLTQVSVSWPSDNTIALASNGSAGYAGYLYFIDPKKGTWRKILGPVAGLSAVVSRDAKYVLYSSAKEGGGVDTAIYDVAKGRSIDAVIRTVSGKCAWGNFYKAVVLCAVPSQAIQGIYPDDWYSGIISTADKIWQIDAVSGTIKLVSPIIDQADRIIDAFNLSLDQNDEHLFFMNKNDLSLWSLDLTR